MADLPDRAVQPPLEEVLTRISDEGHGRWHDEVLPNGGGDSWACVPIGRVIEAVTDWTEARAASQERPQPEQVRYDEFGKAWAYIPPGAQERPQPDHDINCGIDALHLGEDIGCTCYVRSESTPAEALDVERLALVLVKRGPHDIIEDWQRGEGPNATDVAELIAAEYARLSPHNREADR
jgi:hypothetical protein